MSGHLLLFCLLLIADRSLSMTSSYRDFINYTRQVNILHDTLESEGCVLPNIKNLQRREIIGSSDHHRYDIKVEVQKKLYSQLEEILVECRSAAARKESNTTSSTSTTIAWPASPATTTATPTTTTSTSPTTTTTSPPTTATSGPTTTPALTACQSAVNLTEGWRQDHKGSGIKPKNGKTNCDTREMVKRGRPWFRFSGAAGNQLLNKHVPMKSCGTTGSLWSDDTMPIQVGTITQVNVYGGWRFAQRHPTLTKNISVVRCSTSPHDYVYRYDGSVHCYLGFCGMTAA